LTVDVNLTSKFSEVKEKAKAGTLTDQESRAFFSNLNNTLISLKKTIDQLERTMKTQQGGTGAAGGGKSRGAQAEEKERQATAKELENFRGKVKKGGSWIERSSKETSDAVQDLSSKVRKGGSWIERSTKEASDKIEEAGTKAGKKIEKAADEQAEATKRTTWKQREAGKEAERLAEEAKKTAKTLSDAGKTANSVIAESRKMLVQPFKVPKIDKNMAELDKMMARFSNSLSDLTTFIEKQARDAARRSRGRLEVLGEAGKGFKATEREFKLEIVDINALVKEIKKVSEKIGEPFEKKGGARAEDLFKELRSRVARELRSELPGYEKQAQEIAKIMSREMGKVVKAAELMKDKTEQQLEDLFDEKVIQAEFNKLRRDVIKTLSIPRVQATPERGPYLESRTGAQKGIIRFAEFETGLDRLLNTVERNIKEIAKSQDRSVKDVKAEFKDLKLDIVREVTRPEGARAGETQQLFAKLLNLAVKSERGERLVRTGAARAIATGQAREGLGMTGPAFEKLRRDLEKLDINDLNKKFYELSDVLKISTKDIVQSLDKLSFKNIYDRILENLRKEDQYGSSVMRKFFRNLEAGYASALRDFERGIGDITKLLPQVAPNLPKAGLAARETVAVTTAAPKLIREGKYGEYVEERAQRTYQPEVTQREIVALNQALKRYFGDLEATGRLVNEEVKQLSTLGVSEAVGAAIDNIEDIHKVLFKMSALDLTKLGPFGEQFANAARAMSQTMRALGGPQAQFPKLRSRTEQAFIEQGAFGKQGFGYNAVTELRHTANTFEDQVEISGKLTKVITETVRKLVLPAGTVPESLTAQEIDKVGNEIVKLLGERQDIKFSADETFVKEIRQAATVVTGQDVDVQIAKIVEKFFAQWGRKITTRGSTKGLSTFPVGAAAAAGAGVKLGAEDLGIARVPKTMGELASELIENALGKDAETELKKRLVEAGNKFFIDIFSGAESVLGEKEGKELNNLLKDLNKSLGTTFKASASSVEKFRKLYMESLGDTANLFKEMPIEARISLRGVGKRGVQSDILELLANNLIGAVETVLPDAVDLEKFFGKGKKKGVFKKYLEALGYIQEEGEDLAAYTEVFEKGKKRKGIVGEKFLQVVEEPHLKAPWDPRDVESGLKGLRINLQSFAALSSIFGQQSAYIDEIAQASRTSASEARELITAMAVMGSKFDELKPQLLELAQVIGVDELKVFEKAAGSFEDMKGTILDFEKFAQSFVLSFPEAIGGGGLFVPGAAARKTYPEELTGGVGPGPLARKLDLVVDAAQKALEIAGGYGRQAELLPAEDVVRNFENAINKHVNALEEEAKRGARGEGVREKVIKESFKELLSFLKPARAGGEIGDVPAIFTPFKARGGSYAQQTPAETIQASLGHRLGVGTKLDLEKIIGLPFKDIKRKNVTIAKIYADIGRLLRDVVVGSEIWAEEAENIPKVLKRLKDANEDVLSAEFLEGIVPDPEAWFNKLREEKSNWEKYAAQESDIPFLEEKLKKQVEKSEFLPKVQKLLESREDDAEKALRDFAAATKVEVEKFSEESLRRAQERLARARAGYAEELARGLFGKGKAIDVGFFQRQVPAARGQVVNLKVDKIPELEQALTALMTLDAGTGKLSESIKGLQKIIEEQKRLRGEAAAEGRPFVREGEVLLPPKKAELLGDAVYKALKEGAEVFVNTIRFPVTGAPSFQPAIARLMSEEMAGVSPTAIGLPGRAPLDPTEVSKFIGPLNDEIDSLRKQLDSLDREVAKGVRTEESAEMQRSALVSTLETLKSIVESTTTKFAPFEQNLDFDGDALFVHAAQTKAAAEELKAFYNSLQGMSKDIFGVRQAIFNVINAIKEKDLAKIADVADIFKKQFSEEKGFEFLRRPGPRVPEDMTKEEVVNAIGGFLGAEAPEKIAERLGKSVAEATERELKDYLTDLKLGEDIIKLVGHKISIGQVTENMNRIARAAETVVGMGGGVGGRGVPPVGGFLERWAPGAALGEDPAKEFQVRLNELLRFGINAAFKTKHGGGSVYEELVGVLTEEAGAKRLRKEIEKGKGPFGDLAEVNKAIQTTIMDRLRQFSLEEVKKEAKNLGLVVEGDREDIVKTIVEKLDLPGFVAELFNVLREAAVEAEKVKLIKAGKVEDVAAGLAEQTVAGRIQETGRIDVRADITEILQPLYQLRTGMTDLNSIFDQFGDVYKQNIPAWAKSTEEITERMTKAKVASDHLVQSMQDVSMGLTASGDAVTAMMQSYAAQLLDVLRAQKMFATEFGIPTKPTAEELDPSKTLNKLLKAEGLVDLLGTGADPSKIKEVMADTFERLGISDIPREIKDAIRNTVTESAERSVEAGEEVSREQVALVSAIKIAEAQMARIVSELQTLDFKELVARTALPGTEAFARAPITAPRGRRGPEYFIGGDIPGGAMKDPKEVEKFLEKQIAEIRALQDAAKETGDSVSAAVPEGIKSWRDLEDTADASMQELEDAPQKAREAIKGAALKSKEFFEALKEDWDEWTTEADAEYAEERRQQDERMRKSLFDPSTGRLYNPEDVELLSSAERDKLTAAVSDAFSSIGEKTAEEVEAGVKETADAVRKVTSEGVRSWVAKAKSAAQAAGAGGAGAGGGGDDDDDFLKRLKKLREEIDKALGISDKENKIKRFEEIVEALKELQRSVETKDPTNRILDQIQAAINAADSLKVYADPEAAVRIAKQLQNVEGPVPTESIIANLRELQNLAEQTGNLYDDIWGVPEYVKDVLEKIRTAGPRAQFAEEFKNALDEANITGIAESEAWKRYHLAKVEYHLRSAEQFEKLSIEADSLAKTSEFARRAGTSAAQAQKTIRQSYRGASPYLVTSPSATYGVKGRPIDPDLAKAAGVLPDPAVLRAQISEYAKLRKELKPILDLLLNIDTEKMLGPLNKARQAFSALTMSAEEGGDAVRKGLDLTSLTHDITQLRGATEEFLFQNISASEIQRQNLRDTIFYLKDLEKQYSRLGAEVVRGGVLKVPKWLQPQTQKELHKRNLDIIRKSFSEAVSDKGPEALERVGQQLNYTYKVFNEGGTAIENYVYQFKKLGDAFTTAGAPIGRFTEKVDDMNKAFSERRGIGQAFRRVLLWGGAATVVYGTVNALKEMVDTVSQVEMGMVQLRKVMNPVTTNFDEMQRQAVQFAKEFGTPIQSVIASMKVFAQQGLNQAEVLDRSRTSVLAGNVTLLEAADATEALTSATKQFSDEGQGSIRFLDSWIEVAARHAITSKDLALAMQRAGAAAKNAGIDFNQLNAIVTAIGAISRQTGRELGTSVRFFARRLTAQKAPQELAKVGVEAFLPTGEIRPAFEILDELADKWAMLTQAQRLSIAQAIGGRRHYNSILILMDNWQEALETLTHSQNSQGSAMRRNQIVMESFAKKMEQLRQAVVETQLSFGKLALGPAKTLIQSLKWIVERIEEIPQPIKVATLALGAMLVLAHKGAGIVDRLADAWSNLVGIGKAGIGGNLTAGAKSIFGAFKDVTKAGDITEVQSALGKLWYVVLEVGRAYNAFVSNVAAGATKFAILKVATIAAIATLTPLGGVIAKVTDSMGGLGKLAGVSIPILWTISKVFSNLSESGTGVVGSLAPMIASFALLKATIGPAIKEFLAANKTAREFADSQKDTILGLQETAKTIGNLSAELDKLAEKQAKAAKGELTITPGTLTADFAKVRRELGDVVAEILPSALQGFDEWGNAIIRSDELLEKQADTLRKVAQEAENLLNLEIAKRWTKDLEAMNDQTEQFRLGLKNLARAIPVFGESLAKTIRVSPILELAQVRKELHQILAARAEKPLTTIYEEPYRNALERFKTLRTEVRKSVEGLRESIANIPRGKNLGEFLGYVSEYQDQLQAIAQFTRAEKGIEAIDWQDILAVEVFKRLGVNIEAASDLTRDSLEKAGLKLKKSAGALADEYKISIDELKKRAEEGKADAKQFQYRPKDILLFSEEDADRLRIAAGAAMLDIEDTIDGQGKLIVKFLDDTTASWKSLDFTEDIRNLVTSVFSPTDFREYTEESIMAVNKILAGAAANINYPLPIDIGPRFFGQIPTEQLLATGFGRQLGTPAGETTFGRPEYKALFEEDYKRFVDNMRDYRNELEKIEKINQDKLDTETQLAPAIADEFKRLQQIIMNDTAVMQFKAAMEELSKSFEEADRNLNNVIKSEKIRRELLVRTGGLLVGQPQQIPTFPQQPLKIEDASVDELAYATNRRFRDLANSYGENQKRLEDISNRIQMLIKTSDEMKYMKDLYEANKAIVSKDQFDDYVETFKVTGDRNAALMITHLKETADNTGVLADAEKRGQGLATERREFTPSKVLDTAIEKLGGYVGVVGQQAMAEISSIGLGEAAADFDTSTQMINEAAQLFNYAAEKLSQMPLPELLREYRQSLGEVEKATSVILPSLTGRLTKLQFPGTSTAGIEKLFGTALGLRLGSAGYGKGLRNLLGLVETERKKLGLKTAEEKALGGVLEKPQSSFEEVAKGLKDSGQITKEQLDKLLNSNVDSTLSLEKLSTQIGTVVLALGARKGNTLAGLGLGALAGAEVGGQLNLGRVLPGIVGAFLGKQLSDYGKDIEKQRELIAEAAKKGIGKEIFGAAVAKPQGQEVEGMDSLVTEASTQTDLLKSMNTFLAKIAKEDVPADLAATLEDVEKLREKYSARRDIFSLLRSPILFAGVTGLAGIVGAMVDRSNAPRLRGEKATEQMGGVLNYFAQNAEALANVFKKTEGVFEDRVEKLLGEVPEEERLRITPALERMNTFIEAIAEELDLKQSEAVDLVNKMSLEDLFAAVVRFQTKAAQELTTLANSLKVADLGTRIRRNYEAELTGFLKGFRFPGAIEPGRPKELATAEERAYALAPETYESFFQGQEQLQLLSNRLQEITSEMAQLETTISMGKDSSGQARKAFEQLSDQQRVVKQTADALQGSLGKMKEALDQVVLVERLRVTVQEALFSLKKFHSVMKDIDNTSIEMAQRQHPLAEVPPAWEDKDFWKRGMDQFELEMARIRKEKGFLPFDDRERVQWQKEESIIQYNRGKELEKFNQEVSTAKDIYSELYDYQQKWGLDVKGIMDTIASDLERAGDVVYRGGRKEFRGIPSLDNLQDRLADLAKEARDKQFKEQHDALMVPTETILASIDEKLGESIRVQTSLAGLLGSRAEAPTYMTAAQRQAEIDKMYPKKATGGFMSGPGGPKTDSIPAFLSNGEYVLNADSVNRIGIPVLNVMNKTGKIPRFRTGGPVTEEEALNQLSISDLYTKAEDETLPQTLREFYRWHADFKKLEMEMESERSDLQAELKKEFKPSLVDKAWDATFGRVGKRWNKAREDVGYLLESGKAEMEARAAKGELTATDLHKYTAERYGLKIGQGALEFIPFIGRAIEKAGEFMAEGTGVALSYLPGGKEKFKRAFGYDPSIVAASKDLWKDRADITRGAVGTSRAVVGFLGTAAKDKVSAVVKGFDPSASQLEQLEGVTAATDVSAFFTEMALATEGSAPTLKRFRNLLKKPVAEALETSPTASRFFAEKLIKQRKGIREVVKKHYGEDFLKYVDEIDPTGRLKTRLDIGALDPEKELLMRVMGRLKETDQVIPPKIYKQLNKAMEGMGPYRGQKSVTEFVKRTRKELFPTEFELSKLPQAGKSLGVLGKVTEEFSRTATDKNSIALILESVLKGGYGTAKWLTTKAALPLLKKGPGAAWKVLEGVSDVFGYAWRKGIKPSIPFLGRTAGAAASRGTKEAARLAGAGLLFSDWAGPIVGGKLENVSKILGEVVEDLLSRNYKGAITRVSEKVGQAASEGGAVRNFFKEIQDAYNIGLKSAKESFSFNKDMPAFVRMQKAYSSIKESVSNNVAKAKEGFEGFSFKEAGRSAFEKTKKTYTEKWPKLRERAVGEFSSIKDELFSGHFGGKFEGITKKVSGIEESLSNSRFGNFVEIFKDSRKKISNVIEELNILKGNKLLNDTQKEYINNLKKYLRDLQDDSRNAFNDLVGKSGTVNIEQLEELSNTLYRDILKFGKKGVPLNIEEYAADIGTRFPMWEKQLHTFKRMKAKIAPGLEGTEALVLDKAEELLEGMVESWRKTFDSTMGARKNVREGLTAIKKFERKRGGLKLSELDPTDPDYLKKAEQFYKEYGAEFTTEYNEKAFEILNMLYKNADLDPGKVNVIDLGYGRKAFIKTRKDGTLSAVVEGREFNNKFYVETALTKSGKSVKKGAQVITETDLQGDLLNLGRTLQQVLKDYGLGSLEFAPGEGRSLTLGILKTLLVKKADEAAKVGRIMPEQLKAIKEGFKNIETTLRPDRLAVGGYISGPGGPTSDAIPAYLSDGEYVIKASSTAKLGTGMLDYINKFGEVPEFAQGGDIEGVAKAKSSFGKKQKFASKQSIRQYQRDYKKYERENRGFDPKQFIETWPFSDTPFKRKMEILQGLEQTGGVRIKGLSQVLRAFKNTYGYQAGGEVSMGFGQSTIGDLPQEFYRGMFNVSEIERAGYNYDEFREMMMKQGEEKRKLRRGQFEKFMKTKRGFAEGGPAFLNSTQTTAVMTRAEQIAKRLSSDSKLVGGVWRDPQSEFLVQIATLLSRRYVTKKAIENFVNVWERSIGLPARGLLEALEAAPRTAAEVPKAGRQAIPGAEEYYGRKLQTVGGLPVEEIKPPEDFSNVMTSLAKAASKGVASLSDEETATMDRALAKHGFWIDDAGVIRNYAAGGLVRGYAEGGGIAALFDPTKRAEQQEKARQLAEQKKKQIQMYVDYLTGARTEIPNEFSTVSPDLLKGVAAHPDVGFTAEEIKAIQDQGFSWYDIGNAYFENMGGMIRKKFGMGGLIKRYQAGSPGGVTEYPGLPEAEGAPGAFETAASVASGLYGSVASGWAQILELLRGSTETFLTTGKITEEDLTSILDNTVKMGQETAGVLTYVPRSSEGKELLKTVTPVLELPSNVAKVITDEAFFGKHPYYTAEDPGTPYKGNLMDEIFRNYPNTRALFATLAKTGIELEIYRQAARPAGKIFEEPKVAAKQAEVPSSFYDLGDLDTSPGAMKKALQEANAAFAEKRTTTPLDKIQEQYKITDQDILTELSSIHKDFELGEISSLYEAMLDHSEVGDAVRSLMLKKGRTAGRSLEQLVESGEMSKQAASDAIAREFPLSKDAPVEIFDPVIKRLQERLADATLPFEERWQAQQTLKALEDKVKVTKAKTLNDVWQQQMDYLKKGPPRQQVSEFGDLSKETIPLTALEDIFVDPLITKTGTKGVRPGGVASTGKGVGIVETILEPQTARVKTGPGELVDLDIVQISDLIAKARDMSLSETARNQAVGQLADLTTKVVEMRQLSHELKTHARNQTAAMIEQLGVEKFHKYIEQFLDPETAPQVIAERLEARLELETGTRPTTPVGTLFALEGKLKTIRANQEAMASFRQSIKKLENLDHPNAPKQIEHLNVRLAEYAKDNVRLIEEYRRIAEESNAVIQEYSKDFFEVEQAAAGTSLRGGGIVEKIMNFALGGLVRGIPSFQGGGMMQEDGLAFLHAGEEVRTPEQQRADQTLKKVEIDTDAIQKAVEDGIDAAMGRAEVKLADTEVTAKLDTDTVKLDTTEITVTVNTSAIAGGADIEAFIENNNARLSALEGETESFKIAINNNESQIEELTQQMSVLDVENSVQLWNNIESLRTDVKNVNSEVTGRLTSYDNQLIALRRDLTDNANEHTSIAGIAAQARAAAEKALARAMNSS